MDPFDQAQALELRQREEAIARQRARFAPLATVPQCDTALDCLDCGNEIPKARREALPGTMLCVECQTIFEQKKKRGL